jgi:aspartokinase
MERTILKFDRIDLGGARSAAAIENAIDSLGDSLVAVVPAFRGAANLLAEAARRPAGDEALDSRLSFLREGHLAIARAMGAPAFALEAASLRIDRILRRLGVQLAAGLPEDRAEIAAAGTRLSVTCVALAFAALGRPAAIVEPRELGLVAVEGPSGLRLVPAEAAGRGASCLERFPSSVLPGDYGVDASGRTVDLGRVGPAVVTAAVAAEFDAEVIAAETLRFPSVLARSPGVA